MKPAIWSDLQGAISQTIKDLPPDAIGSITDAIYNYISDQWGGQMLYICKRAENKATPIPKANKTRIKIQPKKAAKK